MKKKSSNSQEKTYFGSFNDENNSFNITNPLTPKPWTNYLGNRSLKAFISQNAGGMLWRNDPLTQRITRYHHSIVPPGDRPGFYVYLKNKQSGSVWNPHFAPTCTELDSFSCQHSPGITSFTAGFENAKASVEYTIPPEYDALLMKVTITNDGTTPLEMLAASYLEFGLMEPERETWWICLQYHLSLIWDKDLNAARYDYHVFEAPHTPCMLFGCTEPADSWELSRDAFIGPTGSLERPNALVNNNSLSNSEAPTGGHSAGIIGKDIALAPGETCSFTYVFAMGDTWEEAETCLRHFRKAGSVGAAFSSTRNFWAERLESFQVESGDEIIDRWLNVWNPYNAIMCLEHARSNGPERCPCGLQYRDTTQDAMAVANLDPEFAKQMMWELFAQQHSDGSGCFSYIPGENKQQLTPQRSDNTVWQIYTLHNLAAETGDLSFFYEEIPFRDKGAATVYEHILLGLKYISNYSGPNGLPLRFHADWNDGLAVFEDPDSESVMLGMQLVYACKLLREIAQALGRNKDVFWCDETAKDLNKKLNGDVVWDGAWYRRLLLSNGRFVGSASTKQGQMYLNSQSWAVISGVGESEERGLQAMAALTEQLDTPYGFSLCAPPYKGFPEPEDSPKGSAPGANENGGILFHANTWAIMAEAILGRKERAMKCFKRIIPEALASAIGEARYEREPYAVCSNIAGEQNPLFGRANRVMAKRYSQLAICSCDTVFVRNKTGT